MKSEAEPSDREEEGRAKGKRRDVNGRERGSKGREMRFEHLDLAVPKAEIYPYTLAVPKAKQS